MKRTSDPILYDLRRARAATNKRERATRSSPPEPAPDDRTSPPNPAPPESVDPEPVAEQVATPPPVEPGEKNVSLKTTPTVDEVETVPATIETNEQRGGLDWLLRR